MTDKTLAEIQENYPVSRDFLCKMPDMVRERAILIQVSSRTQTARKEEPVFFVDTLIAGTMRVLNEFESGNIYSFAYLSPLSYIGSYEVVARRESFTATTESVSDCTLIRLQRRDFSTWFKRDPWFTQEVAFRMASSTCDQSYKHGEVRFYPAAYLIADYFIRMFESLNGDPKRIPANRQEIAEHLGFSIRTINRCIRIFREEGLVGAEKGKILLSDSQYNKLKGKCEELKGQL